MGHSSSPEHICQPTAAEDLLEAVDLDTIVRAVVSPKHVFGAERPAPPRPVIEQLLDRPGRHQYSSKGISSTQYEGGG